MLKLKNKGSAVRRLFTLGLIALVAVITGCANNANIDTNKDYWQHKPNTVVIVTTHTDKPQYADENAYFFSICFQHNTNNK